MNDATEKYLYRILTYYNILSSGAIMIRVRFFFSYSGIRDEYNNTNSKKLARNARCDQYLGELSDSRPILFSQFIDLAEDPSIF